MYSSAITAHNLAFPSTAVSLLVPQALLQLLASQISRHNSCLSTNYRQAGLRLYLSHLINSAQRSSPSDLPFASKANTLYQQPGLDLVRLNVRIPLSLWCQFRALARSRGVSICYLFVFLLEQDGKESESIKDVGTMIVCRIMKNGCINLPETGILSYSTGAKTYYSTDK